jgi:hypothetical protein
VAVLRKYTHAAAIKLEVVGRGVDSDGDDGKVGDCRNEQQKLECFGCA